MEKILGDCQGEDRADCLGMDPADDVAENVDTDIKFPSHSKLFHVKQYGRIICINQYRTPLNSMGQAQI
jgi:hypothetical protein